MKNFITGLCLAFLATTANAGNVIFGVGYGQEKINNRLTVDLYQLQGLYRLDNGIMIGGSIQQGYPDNSAVTTESRMEIIIGYGTRFYDFSPYAFISLGERDRNAAGKHGYHTFRVGSQYSINDKIYLNASYRFRDTDQSNWKTDTYFVGAGFNIDKSISIELQHGKTSGSFNSDSLALFLIQRF